MPLLVRKKLVSADCACAGALTAAEMAAMAKHAGKMVRVKLFIKISLLFLWTVCHQPTAARIIPPDQERRTASGTSGSCQRPITRQRKRRRGTNRSALPVTLWRSAGLLDRREFPIRAATAAERPHFGRCERGIAAGNQPAGGALHGYVDQREPHRHAGEIGFAFAPGFGKVALQQLDVGHLVDVVAGLVLE